MSTLPSHDHTSSSTPSLDGRGGAMNPVGLIALRATNEKDVLARTELAQRHSKTLSDLAEAKSKIAHLELQLKISQEAQPDKKMASDHTSSSTPSSDGKGGTDSAAKGRKSTKRMGSGYSAFESNHHLYKNNRFIGRVPAKSFPPPHTVASIKLFLCELEHLSEPDKALVFTPLSSPAPKEDSARLSLSAPSGPGLSEQDPIALVVKSEKRTKEVSQSEKLPERSDDTDIHYGKFCQRLLLIYSLGRINTLSIAPPHTAGSLKACIAQVEDLVIPNHRLHKYMELFQDINSDAAMSDSDVISFQSDTYPGSDEGDPVVLVNATANTVLPDPAADYNKYDSAWLSTTKVSWAGYMAINSKGEKGFVHQIYITLIDR
ncbi:uncharacterized protein LACBIDRAFT_328165 [Laccaria bicolor S238N-H82]|uniref:Predicted protein n=1 Tax=Laccaria bicolor (strain S238N-H82 / ATCC MYA-4686) TaxID=486041 RepID=B0DDY3_LACBS|nr:uncharacterized protein LACBIDRAFT_328165 [Laccaria bicolor S238N-H82]EDR07298.1 predicted protein [Laccaria bicolor S238N-H82]|eukprot:XP_001882229.1 predicted protein [Laccaria bicolor S238N-H82]